MDYKERQRIISDSPISFNYLKRFNAAAGFLHLIQGILMLAAGLMLDWSRDIYTFYLDFSGFPPAPKLEISFTVGYLGAILASFPLISAVAHFSVAYLRNKNYNENLKKGMNPYRWYEYAFSSSIMIVLIA
jgi:hypothetical protein